MIGKNIVNLIIKSPFKLLKEHMECTSFCAKKILPFIKSIENKKWEKAHIYYIEIHKLEKDSYHIKKNLKIILSNSLFMNISKTDLLALLKIQDKIFNQIKYISSLLISKKIELPLFFVLDNKYYQFIQSCVDACNEVFLIITKLEKAIDNGFPKKDIQIINSMIKKLYMIEKVSNKFQVIIRKSLFKTGNIILSIEIIYLYKIIDLTGNISSMSRQIGKRVRSILVN